MPPLAAKTFGLISSALGIAFIISIVLWNYGNFYTIRFPSTYLVMGRALGFAQRWTLFAPKPVSYNGWNVIDGTLASGEHINVFDPSQPLYTDKPLYVYTAYRNDIRWLKYFEAIDGPGEEMYRPYLASYMCNAWNSRHKGGDKLAHVNITFTRIFTRTDYQPGTATSSVIASRDCFGK
jgi:hypothetical protein